MRICGWLRRRFGGYTVVVTSGNAQTDTVGTTLGTALTVTVRAAGTGALASGATVHWVAGGDGTITASSQTNGSGVASATWTLGTFAGTQLATATVAGGGSVTFSATASAGTAASVAANSSTSQSGPASTPVSTDPSVRVLDAYGNGKSGVTVAWAVTAGGGSVDDTGGTTTDADGIATVTSWTLGSGVGANALTATCAGLTGSPVTFAASATAAAPDSLTVVGGGSQTGIVAGQAASPITFRVKDSGATALEGVTVSFAVTGSATLSVASAVSDASGDVSVTPTTHTVVETVTVTATCPDGAGGTVEGSTTVAATFGSATRLNIVTQPAASGASGVALSQQPSVEVTDVNGNRVTSSSATVTASIGSGNAQITAGSTANASSGLATFSGMTINDTDGGNNFVLFTSGALTEATSQAVVLIPPIPDRLAVGQDASAVNVGTTISPSPTVLVQDASSVTVPGATNSVTVALGDNGEGATLTRNGTSNLTVDAVNGVATFSGLAVSIAGSYTLVYTSGSLTGATSSAFNVSGTSAYPNEPGGFAIITQRTFASATDNSWTTPSGGAIDTTQTDALISPPNAWKFTKGAGSAGSSFGTTEKNISASNKTRLYIADVFKLSAGFQGHLTGTNKIAVWPWVGSTGTKIFTNAFGVGQGVLRAELYLQGCPPSIGGNDASGTRQIRSGGGFGPVTITRGVYHLMELDITLNTSDTADGAAKMWLDGVQVFHVTNLCVRGTTGSSPTGASAKFHIITCSPIWGGGGDTVPAGGISIWHDHIYVSG